VYASHAGFHYAAPDAFHFPVAVNVLPGGSLKTAVAVRGGSAVNTALFIIVVLMKSVNAAGTARTIGGGTAIRTFASHNYPLSESLK